MKRLILGCLCILTTSLVYAQTQHTVSRGETPESIANYYGITVIDLQEANPNLDFSEYFYSGMKLNIPDKNKRNKGKDKKKEKKEKKNTAKNDKKPEVNNAGETPLLAEDKVKSSNDKPVKAKSKRLSPSDFTSVSLLVGGESPTEFTGGYYALRGQYFRPSGFGASLICASTYGFSSFGDIILKIGPSYVYSITKWLYVEGTLSYDLTIADTEYSSGLVSGLSLTPEIGVSFGKFRIGIGIEGIWRNGGGVSGGCYLGVGYAFK